MSGYLSPRIEFVDTTSWSWTEYRQFLEFSKAAGGRVSIRKTCDGARVIRLEYPVYCASRVKEIEMIGWGELDAEWIDT